MEESLCFPLHSLKTNKKQNANLFIKINTLTPVFLIKQIGAKQPIC